MKNSKSQRRQLIMVAVLVALAIGGLLLIDTNPVTAERGLNSSTSTTAISATPESPADPATPIDRTMSVWPSFMRMASALVVVIACIYGGIFLLKRLGQRRYGAGGQRCALEVLETVGIAPRQSVALVRVQDKAVLVGVSENGVSMLTELSADDTASLLETQTTEQRSQPAFGAMLQSALGAIGRVGQRKQPVTAKSK